MAAYGETCGEEVWRTAVTGSLSADPFGRWQEQEPDADFHVFLLQDSGEGQERLVVATVGNISILDYGTGELLHTYTVQGGFSAVTCTDEGVLRAVSTDGNEYIMTAREVWQPTNMNAGYNTFIGCRFVTPTARCGYGGGQYAAVGENGNTAYLYRRTANPDLLPGVSGTWSRTALYTDGLERFASEEMGSAAIGYFPMRTGAAAVLDDAFTLYEFADGTYTGRKASLPITVSWLEMVYLFYGAGGFSFRHTTQEDQELLIFTDLYGNEEVAWVLSAEEFGIPYVVDDFRVRYDAKTHALVHRAWGGEWAAFPLYSAEELVKKGQTLRDGLEALLPYR